MVSKLATLFKHLEETTHFLSTDLSPPNTGKIFALCEILLEDLNNYGEAMIPIDASNTLNIKLFPTYPPPPSLSPHNVPLTTVRLSALVDDNWDLTMLRILPFINGINSLCVIARLADAEYRLVRKAVAHLLYYGCAILLDVFNFGASYAPTAEIGAFVADLEMQEEARRYILGACHVETGVEQRVVAERLRESIDGPKLVELYCSLKQGNSLRNWCMDHAEIVGIIDVRRFITFGVIKGFLYRVHKYAVATGGAEGLLVGKGSLKTNKKGLRHDSTELGRFLDGTHCFDEICTELMISEKDLLGRLKAWGEVQIIHR